MNQQFILTPNGLDQKDSDPFRTINQKAPQSTISRISPLKTRSTSLNKSHQIPQLPLPHKSSYQT